MSFAQQVTFLPVADLDRAASFYGGTLGLEEVLDQGTCRIYRAAPSAFVGICERVDAAPSPGVIVTLVTGDVDGWHETLRARGVVFESSPRRSERYDIYHAFLRDPDGHLLEIQEFCDPNWPRN